MACEVICCDIGEIIDTLVESSDGAIIEQLFSLLQLEAPLDSRLAGYFEKVVGLLLQRKTLQMITFINKKGTDLFALFTKHIDSFSILELIKRKRRSRSKAAMAEYARLKRLKAEESNQNLDGNIQQRVY